MQGFDENSVSKIKFYGRKGKNQSIKKKLQKMFIEPPCKAEEEEHNEDKDRKGCAVLVKGRDDT